MIGPADATITAVTAFVIALIAVLAIPANQSTLKKVEVVPFEVVKSAKPIRLRLGHRTEQSRLRMVEENLDTQSVRIKEINQKLDLILTPEEKTDATRSKPR